MEDFRVSDTQNNNQLLYQPSLGWYRSSIGLYQPSLRVVSALYLLGGISPQQGGIISLLGYISPLALSRVISALSMNVSAL